MGGLIDIITAITKHIETATGLPCSCSGHIIGIRLLDGSTQVLKLDGSILTLEAGEKRRAANERAFDLNDPTSLDRLTTCLQESFARDIALTKLLAGI